MTWPSRAAFLYRLGLIVPSAVAVAVFLYVALARAAYPFAIEWLEAATLTHVTRVLEGKPIYAAPSYDCEPVAGQALATLTGTRHALGKLCILRLQ